MPISRATENGIFLVMTNAPAFKDDLNAAGSSHGESKVVHPDGNVMVEAGIFTQETLVQDLLMDFLQERVQNEINRVLI